MVSSCLSITHLMHTSLERWLGHRLSKLLKKLKNYCQHRRYSMTMIILTWQLSCTRFNHIEWAGPWWHICVQFWWTILTPPKLSMWWSVARECFNTKSWFSTGRSNYSAMCRQTTAGHGWRMTKRCLSTIWRVQWNREVRSRGKS